MNANRRNFLGAIAATSVTSAIAATQANAQTPTPRRTAPAPATPTDRELTGKVAIVTGARNNLGRGVAVALARNGADVVVHYHREATRDQAEETARLVQQQGTRTLLVPGDLSQVANIKRLFDETTKTFGRLDILVHTAGIMVKKPLAQVTEAEYDRAAGINAKGTFFIMQEAIRRIQDNGRIINFGSSLLAANIPNYSTYGASKAAMEHVTRALAKEIDWKRNITVNTIGPGPVDTSFLRDSERPEGLAAATRLVGRLGTIDDIVPLVEFLASPQSRWVNGQTIFINGGYVGR
ncbi:SDR family oxidoreductase [Nostoc sp.]|uniref:SDR family oxidoreductase n=1 Tax=Nostoc sp. TaxID=1180 RepID=UPI002FF44B59